MAVCHAEQSCIMGLLFFIVFYRKKDLYYALKTY